MHHVVPMRASHLSESDVRRLQRKLQNLRASLVAEERGGMIQQPAKPDTGDSADLAEVTYEQEVTSRRLSFDANLLREVEDALARIEAGTYGLSEESGEPIELARLEAI